MDWDEFVAPCPNCEGAGCDICSGGKLVVPNKVQTYIGTMDQNLMTMRKTRQNMLDTYQRWIRHANDDKAGRIMELLMEANIYSNLEDTPEGKRSFDLMMTKDILDVEDRLEMQREMIEKGRNLVGQARSLWREAMRAVKERNREPEPPPPPPREEPKHTKSAGKVCSYPKCKKDTYVTDEKGRGWCKKHGYARGLLERPKIEEEDES